MLRRAVLKGLVASGLLHCYSRLAKAQDILKFGVCIPMTGAGFNAVGRQLASAIRLYVEQHGNVVAGRKIEIVVRDDGGVADNARRIVQEMIVNDKVALIGIGITPTSLAIAPLITEARIPTPRRLTRARAAVSGIVTLRVSQYLQVDAGFDNEEPRKLSSAFRLMS